MIRVNRIWRALPALLLAIFIALTAASTASARFLSPDTWDPMLAGVDINRYAYANDDPINLSDPNGHGWIEDGIDYYKTPEERDAKYRGYVQGYNARLNMIEDRKNDSDDPLNQRGYEDERDAALAAKDRYESLMGLSDGEWFDRVYGTGKSVTNIANLNKVPRTAGSLGPSLGKRFETVARKRYDTGPSTPYNVNGNKRIADGINTKAGTITTISEVKYVKYQGYTAQIKDMVTYAKRLGYQARLIVPRGTYLSRPLRDAARRGDVTIIRTGMKSKSK